MDATSSGTRPAGALRLPVAVRIPSPALQGLLALAVYLTGFILAAGMPLISHLNVPNLRQYWTDPQFYAWSMRWWPYAVSHLDQPAVLNRDRGAAGLQPGLGEHHSFR